MSSPRIFLVATEESGDRLGAALMSELRLRFPNANFAGVGGRGMAGQGLVSAFPIEDLSIIGFAAVATRLPLILRRLRETTAQALAFRPDVMVAIDSPDFTQRVARRVRARDASIPIVGYVSPSVWAWRPGRARAMHAYIDRLLALLPFEPEVHRRLGGPPCVYVGHPLLQQLELLRPSVIEAARREVTPPVLAVLPGSRRSELNHHLDVFGATLARLSESGVKFESVLPTLPHLQDAVRAATANWTIRPRIEVGDTARHAVFRTARAALAKSGTVTLELALAGVPMVTAYRVAAWEAWIIRRAIRLTSVILPNIILGENVVPEFLQENCTPEPLAAALADVLADGEGRRHQLAAFERLDSIMSTGGVSAAQRAADEVAALIRSR